VKNILSTLLLFVFFAGQVNLAWAKHYCDEKLVSSELTVNPKSHDCCGSENSAPMDCCEDQIAQADSDDFFEKSEIKTQVAPEFILSYLLTGFGNAVIIPDFSPFYQYISDIPIQDLQVMYQTFLI
jgi:hypothetical protein